MKNYECFEFVTSFFLYEVSFYLFSNFLNNSYSFHSFRSLFDHFSPINPRQQAMTRYLLVIIHKIFNSSALWEKKTCKTHSIKVVLLFWKIWSLNAQYTHTHISITVSVGLDPISNEYSWFFTFSRDIKPSDKGSPHCVVTHQTLWWIGLARLYARGRLRRRLVGRAAAVAGEGRLNGIMEFHAISHFADEKQMK